MVISTVKRLWKLSKNNETKIKEIKKMTWDRRPYSSLSKPGGLTWYGRIVLWVASLIATIILIGLAAIGAMVMFSTFAHAKDKDPAIITENGKPSSKRGECDARRRFAEIVVKMRVHKSVNDVLDLVGNEKEIGQHVYFQCLDGEGS